MEESVKRPSFSPRKCTACWKCAKACPQHAIRKVGFLWHKHAMITYRNCIGCNICVKTCPQGCFKCNAL